MQHESCCNLPDMVPLDPEMGSRPFYSTADICVAVRTLIEDNGGDKGAALKALFGGSCSWASAREYSVHLAHCFELSEAEFMACYSRWKKGQAIL
jgi:hypothetical protein